MKKKEITETLRNELSLLVSAKSRLSRIIGEYVDWITENVPEEYREAFGVGVAGSHSQFGRHWGICTEGGEYPFYAVPSEPYFIAGDFTAHVNGCTDMRILKEVAAKIPGYIEAGKKAIARDTEEAEQIINNLHNLKL